MADPQRQSRFELKVGLKGFAGPVAGEDFKPFVVVSSLDPSTTEATQLCRSQALPSAAGKRYWDPCGQVDYMFKAKQPMVVDLYHESVPGSDDLGAQMFVGRYPFDLGELSAAAGHTMYGPVDPAGGPQPSVLAGVPKGQVGYIAVIGKPVELVPAVQGVPASRCLQAYLAGGLQIQVMVSIDFTSSNGDSFEPDSLHHLGDEPNQYQRTLKRTLETLAPYDADGMIPAFGYGARAYPPAVSHCFPLSFGDGKVELPGVAGVMAAYSQAAQTLRYAAPTNFAPSLVRAIQEAQTAKDTGNSYVFLFILTDGRISDMQETKDRVVEAANSLPLSIVIVGVGDADFESMVELDADDTPLVASDGTQAESDIVQFVPYRDFADKSLLDDEFSQSVLEEIPEQIERYHQTHGIAPLPPTVPTVIF